MISLFLEASPGWSQRPAGGVFSIFVSKECVGFLDRYIVRCKVPSETRGSNHIGGWFRGIYKIP